MNGNKYIIWCDKWTYDTFHPYLILFEQDALYCVSSEPRLQGKKFPGMSRELAIYAPEKIQENPDAVLIMAANNAYDAMRAALHLKLPNAVGQLPLMTTSFGWVPCQGSPNKESAIDLLDRVIATTAWSIKHQEETYAIYNADDPCTRTMLDHIFHERIHWYRDISQFDFPFCESEYYYDRQLAPDGEFTYVSCGAYRGRDILHMNALFRDNIKKIFAIEPYHEHFSFLQYTLQQAKLHHVTTYANGYIGESHTETPGDVPTYSLDSLLASDDAVHGKLVIQMDVECAERAALKGAENIIRRYHPYLAIACYHTIEDILELPQCLLAINPEYSFYLSQGIHNVIYAVPDATPRRGSAVPMPANAFQEAIRIGERRIASFNATRSLLTKNVPTEKNSALDDVTRHESSFVEQRRANPLKERLKKIARRGEDIRLAGRPLFHKRTRVDSYTHTVLYLWGILPLASKYVTSSTACWKLFGLIPIRRAAR